jgi:hypothetical protein
MIAYYMDENVHGAITRGLRQRSVDVLRAQDDGYMERPDDQVLDRATELERVLFSHDDDQLREATSRQRRRKMCGGLVYAHQLDVSIGRCIADLEYLAQSLEPLGGTADATSPAQRS